MFAAMRTQPVEARLRASRAVRAHSSTRPSARGRFTSQMKTTFCRLIAVASSFGLKVASVARSDHRCRATRYVSRSSFSSITAVCRRYTGSGWTRTNQLLSGLRTGTDNRALRTPMLALKSCESRRDSGSNGSGPGAGSGVVGCSKSAGLKSVSAGLSDSPSSLCVAGGGDTLSLRAILRPSFLAERARDVLLRAGPSQSGPSALAAAAVQSLKLAPRRAAQLNPLHDFRIAPSLAAADPQRRREPAGRVIAVQARHAPGEQRGQAGDVDKKRCQRGARGCLMAPRLGRQDLGHLSIRGRYVRHLGPVKAQT